MMDDYFSSHSYRLIFLYALIAKKKYNYTVELFDWDKISLLRFKNDWGHKDYNFSIFQEIILFCV